MATPKSTVANALLRVERAGSFISVSQISHKPIPKISSVGKYTNTSMTAR